MGSVDIASLKDSYVNNMLSRACVGYASTESEWMAVLDSGAAMVSSGDYNRVALMDTGMGSVVHLGPQESYEAVHFERPDGRDPCPWCGAQFYPSKFHPGNCGECGGPKNG